MRVLIRMSFVLLAAVSTVLPIPNVYSETILIDDFGDGKDNGWAHIDFVTRPATAVFDATSFEYVISSDRSLPSGETEAAVAYWARALNDARYSDGILQATMRFDNEMTSAETLMRFKPAPWQGYIFFANQSLNVIGIDRLPHPSTPLAMTSYDLTSGQDYIIKGTAIGSDLSMKIWAKGDPEPEEPQVSVSDRAYSSGALGVVAYRWETEPASVMSARFDDIYFTVIPEPSALFLSLIGISAVSIFRHPLKV